MTPARFFFPARIFDKLRPVLFAAMIVVLTGSGLAAQSRKFSLTPAVTAGLTSGYDKDKALHVDLGNSGAMARFEVLAGYRLDACWSVYTGGGLGIYNYRMHFSSNNGDRNKDTIRIQSENLIEIPLGLRYTFSTRKRFATRHYLGAGLRFCLLDGVSADYHTIDGSLSGNDKKSTNFNGKHIRLFLEGGWDIPVENNFAFIIGFSVSEAITRNMNKGGALSDANDGMFSGGASLGFRFGL